MGIYESSAYEVGMGVFSFFMSGIGMGVLASSAKGVWVGVSALCRAEIGTRVTSSFLLLVADSRVFLDRILARVSIWNLRIVLISRQTSRLSPGMDLIDGVVAPLFFGRLDFPSSQALRR